ncbi:hypothetical protein [Asinibacterium sp. OR53]|uniref:hypothetical protein n=1 Tax=Asinibacterium sp. OR53 TaxID=925409 RepID=UPI00047E227C|nr:hypothetical protein [Asinibacterium sp. OR53]
MKKILMGVLMLTVITAGISITQISCQKSSAQTTGTGANNLNQLLLAQDTALVIYDYNGNTNGVNIASVSLNRSLWSSPMGPYYILDAKLSPDSKIVFVHTRAYSRTNNPPDIIYSMDNTGNNVKKVITSSQRYGASLSINSIDIR